MNKINIYVLMLFLSLAGVSIHAQNNRSQVVITSRQDNNVFFHTIERGQTVYAIATMYGVTPDDIYRLNPDSKEGIKAGATLKSRNATWLEVLLRSRMEIIFPYHTAQRNPVFIIHPVHSSRYRYRKSEPRIVYFHFYDWQDNPYSGDASRRFADNGAQDHYQRN